MIEKKIMHLVEGKLFSDEEDAKDFDLHVQIYKNLHKFLEERSILNVHGMFTFLVKNKKEIIKLLTDGNLDTVYAPRSFTKEGG